MLGQISLSISVFLLVEYGIYIIYVNYESHLSRSIYVCGSTLRTPHAALALYPKFPGWTPYLGSTTDCDSNSVCRRIRKHKVSVYLEDISV